MTEFPVITLGQRTLAVRPLPLGKLRRLVPAFNRAGRAFALGSADDAAFDDVFAILSEATELPVKDIEAIPGTWQQLMAAIDTVAGVCGLKKPDDERQGAPDAGEARPGASASPASTTPGTPSTPA